MWRIQALELFAEAWIHLAQEELVMSKREEIEPHAGDKRYVRRNAEGQFKSEVDEGRSLSADSRQKAKHPAKPGQGDRGDGKAR